MGPVDWARRAGAGARNGARTRLIRYGRIVGGTCLTAAGLLLLILPGPGIPLLVGGFVLLEREVEWARPLRLELLRRLRSIRGAARQIAARIVGRGTSAREAQVEARPLTAPAGPPSPREPWVSRKHWRRALAISIKAGHTQAERRKLLARLARVRTDEPARASGRLRFVRGGDLGTGGTPLPGSAPKEGA